MKHYAIVRVHQAGFNQTDKKRKDLTFDQWNSLRLAKSRKETAITISGIGIVSHSDIMLYEEDDTKNKKKEEKYYPPTRYERNCANGWTDEEKRDWKLVLSGFVVQNPQVMGMLLPNIIQNLAISIFNMPNNSELRNKTLQLGDENFDYKEFVNYSNN